jgi:hypothetical protein
MSMQQYQQCYSDPVALKLTQLEAQIAFLPVQVWFLSSTP